MNYFRQILFEMRHYKVMMWVSVSGTALAIFLVMSFLMVDRLYTVEIPPESNRSRIMKGEGIHIRDKEGSMDMATNGLDAGAIRKLYSDLDGVEVVSYSGGGLNEVNVGLNGENNIKVSSIRVDENFWKVFDFRFIDGHPFDEADRKANAGKVVITASLARRLFKEENVSGREIELSLYPYTVVGVVQDGSPLLTNSYADIYEIYNIENEHVSWNGLFGSNNVRLLLKEGTDPAYVKKQVEERYGRLESESGNDKMEIVYHGQPYTQEDINAGIGYREDPATKKHRQLQWIIYTILILLPAINLSSMTRSRLRQRVSEIGVRRAFGAKRLDIVAQLFGENLIITFIGGLIGLILSFIFILMLSHLFFSFKLGGNSIEMLNSRPDFFMVFRWSNFFLAVAGCLILNILSATVPAWKASRVQPAVAISTR